MIVAALDAGFRRIELSPSDELVITPAAVERTEGLQVVGGASVVAIGGRVRFSSAERKVAEIYKNVSRRIFIEGRHILMESSADAFVAGGTSRHETPFVLFPDVYIQNCRVEGVRGAYDALHADVFQMDLSANSINIDKLTADTNYQVLFMRPEPNGGRILSHIDLRRCNFRKNGIPGDPEPTKLIYFASSDEELAAAGHRIFLSDVWCEIPAGQDPRAYVYPMKGGEIAEDVLGRFIWWPGLGRQIVDLQGRPGRVRIGRPPQGDFVPAASVGFGYVSPGYQDSGR